MSYDDVRWLKMQNQGNLAQAKFREDKKDFSRSIQNHQNKNLENHSKYYNSALSPKLVRLTTSYIVSLF